ncbi:MAG: hypothetical protein KA297_26040 [Kofleriaceae bacterium]|jgi:hypothetical protein|nr:hypothetical protein [Kofleriaceae bacterium]
MTTTSSLRLVLTTAGVLATSLGVWPTQAAAAPLPYPFCDVVGDYSGAIALGSVAPGCAVTWTSTVDQPTLRARLTRAGVVVAETTPSASTVMVPQDQLTCGEPTQTVSVVLHVRTATFTEAIEGDLVEFSIDTTTVGSAIIGAVEDTCLPIDFAGTEPCYLACGGGPDNDPSLGCAASGSADGAPLQSGALVGLVPVGAALLLGRRRRTKRPM